MNWKSIRAILMASAMVVGAAVLSNSVAPPPAYAAAPIITKNEALVKALKDAQTAAAGQRWAEALAKAKEADAIREDKPASLNPQIHEMIIGYAVNAKDYASAMTQLDKNIASGEGNKLQNLKTALGIAITAKDKAKTDQYARELGTNLDTETRLFIASQMASAGQLKESLEYAKPALEGNPTEAALKFEQAVYFKMNDANGRRAALEQLVSNYPKAEYWHDLLQLARNERGLNDEQVMDIYRLRLAVGDLKTDADYQEMAQEALIAGYPAEAKAVLDKAAAEKLLKGERAERLVKTVNDRVAADAAAQAELQKKAGADPNSALKLGLMYWSSHKDKEAEDSIRKAMAGKVADPDEAKVALGHVLLTQGKKQDAVAAFGSVPRASKEANVARLWAIYARRPEPETAAPARRRG